MAPTAFATDPDTLPRELGAAYQATFTTLQNRFRAKGLSQEEAADLAQEAVTRTLVHLRRRGQTHDEVTPLINTVAKHVFIEKVRSKRPAPVPLDDAIDVAWGDDADPVADELSRRELHQLVHDAIESLTPRHRRAMLLSLEGLTPNEIAQHMGLDRNAAYLLLFRARRGLADRLATAKQALYGGLPAVGVSGGLGSRTIGRITGALQQAGPAAAQWVGSLGTAAALVALGVIAAAPSDQLAERTPSPAPIHPSLPAATVDGLLPAPPEIPDLPVATPGIPAVQPPETAPPLPSLPVETIRKTALAPIEQQVRSEVVEPAWEQAEQLARDVPDGLGELVGGVTGLVSDLCGLLLGTCDGDSG